MQIHLILIVTILFSLFVPRSINAQPVINSVSGNLMDEQPVALAGSGFGSHTLKIEWLGGPSGNIEQGTPGADVFSGGSARNGWYTGTAGNPGYARTPASYSTTRAHSGNQSILVSWPGGQYTTDLYYDYGSAIGKIYVTWWVYWDWGGGYGGQWKLWRLRPDSSVYDTNGEIIQSDWYNVDGSHYQQYIMYFCNYLSYDQCYPNSDAQNRWIAPQGAPDPGAWMRLELYAEASSTDGARDGTIIFNAHKQTTPVYKTKEDIGTVITRATGVTAQWRYFHWENYLGDKLGGDHSVPKVYLDDIYLQVGTQARVELCDSNNWQNRKHCEIQPASSWNNNSVGISPNKGSFQNGNIAYLYVIDSGGNVSNKGQGYPITLGSPVSNAPAPPTRLHIVN